MAKKRLPAAVIALGTVSLLTDLSSEMIYPLVPAFLTTVLGAGAISLGLVEGVAETTASIVKIVSGRRTDTSGRRKPLIVGGYATSGVARPLIGFASVWPMVVVLRFLDRVGKGLRTAPRDALIVDVVAPQDRGRAYGLHRAMDHGGAVLGPLVAAALIGWFGFGIRQVIWAAAIPAVLVMVVLVAWVREPQRDTGTDGAAADVSSTDLSAGIPRELRPLLIAVLVFTLGNATDAFFLLRLGEVGLSTAAVAMVWGAHSAVKMVATWAGGHLSDRRGRRPLITAGWLMYAAVYAAFGWIESDLLLIGTFLAYGITFGLTEPSERAWVADIAGPANRGAAFGWYHGTVGVAALPASLIFGVLYQWQGAVVPFMVAAGMAVVATVLLRRVREPEQV